VPNHKSDCVSCCIPFTMVISLQVNSNAYNCAVYWVCICEKCFQMFYFINSFCSQASSQSLKPYSLGVLFVNEVMCMDKANGLLFDLHCCKDICLFHYLEAMEVVPGFAVSCHHCFKVCSYVYFNFKPVLYICKELLRYICLGTFIPLFLPFCFFPLLFHLSMSL